MQTKLDILNSSCSTHIAPLLFASPPAAGFLQLLLKMNGNQSLAVWMHLNSYGSAAHRVQHIRGVLCKRVECATSQRVPHLSSWGTALAILTNFFQPIGPEPVTSINPQRHMLKRHLNSLWLDSVFETFLLAEVNVLKAFNTLFHSLMHGQHLSEE